jgi:lipopolysaccharide transport system ATP-binding protein
MSETVIKVEHLSKQYRIGAREGYRTFRETLVDAVKTPLQGLSKVFNRRSAVGGRSSGDDTIWALEDVSFEVKQGEVVGIIGRNGAGKSTLLKILSRITEPTEGRVELRGRVGSLLEVGTGFHPELTGHENIYLYGAILGMDRWEITRKFDEIVAFAELDKFIDTPVKKYSSGMYMRLAFAVAAHLEPEILLVDEVLAVGDAQFQKKCLGKMGDVAKEGRTVLFVSHQLEAIQRLCGSCLLIREGHLEEYNETPKTIKKYLDTEDRLCCSWHNASPDTGAKGYLKSIRVLDAGNQPRSAFHRDEEIFVEMILFIGEKNSNWVLRCDLLKDGAVAFRTSDFDTLVPGEEKGLERGTYEVKFQIPAYFLNYGTYSVKPHFGIYDVESVFYPHATLISIEVSKEVNCNNFIARLEETRHPGAIYPRLIWKIRHA